jgi:hypothetical protein
MLANFCRAGMKVDDELPAPHHSGYVQVEEKQPLFEHQKVKPKEVKAPKPSPPV